MSFLDDFESFLSKIKNLETPAESALALVKGILDSLQGALNAPNQHEQLQKVVNLIGQNQNALAEAVANEGDGGPQQA